ncbi:hypothetical protein AALP_AA7G015200 [Arabis alpina]|uniref:Phorbol-ester/DAG-type domain-containing protein n=1 Tax=Arabis alpina TaxID=50452 RepID=A0A087GFC6_ARAAL|nr:hypothetical protein AALP_AA7G015200 [Arabis alpina]
MDGQYGGYSCVCCLDYVVHSRCATNEEVWDGKELEEVSEKEDDHMLNLHFSHQHGLRLENEDIRDIVCSGCALPIASETFYRCDGLCNFYLHERCANLPQKKNTFLHVHPLTLCTDERSSISRCVACKLHFNGFRYRCLECKDVTIEFDIRCCSVSDPYWISDHDHDHPLYVTVPTNEIGKANKICSSCGLEELKLVLSCSDCSLRLCMRCATLPTNAVYKYDKHLLRVNSGHEAVTSLYLCDICEKKIEEKGSFYACFQCGPVLHTNCALGSFRHMRPGLSFTSHDGGRKYQVVLNDRILQVRCSQCHVACHEPLFLTTGTTKMTEAIPKAVKDMWDKWNIRGLVIFSLLFQAILVLFSPNRKRTPMRLFRLLIWSSYILANWAADYAVGQISDSAGDNPEPNESPKTNELLAFWAMFLLLHLGGPDTITALALEDNELWLRSLFGLVCQFIVTLYVFLLSIPNSLLVPTSLMLVAGVIKYVERIGAMHGASLKRFKDSMLGDPEPGNDYTRFMEEYKIRKILKEPSQLVRIQKPKKEQGVVKVAVRPKRCLTPLQVVQHAYKYFNIYKGLVVDFIYTSQQWTESKQFFHSLLSEDALRILEVELSFIYGTLFTKVDILHTWIGATFRCIALGCLFTSLYIFKTSRKDGYDRFDVGLTYALIFGGIALDLISILIFSVSDWTFARMSKPKEELDKKHTRLFLKFWFGIPMINYLLEFFGIPDQVNEMVYTSRERLTEEVWDIIYEEVKRRSAFVVGMEGASHIYSARGEWILRDMKVEITNEKLLAHVTEVDYDQSLLVWHIATELLHQTEEDTAERHVRYKEFSKTLSEYMMYLLIVQPSLMSTVAGIDKIKFREAIAEAKRLQKAVKQSQVSHVTHRYLYQRKYVEDSRDAKMACQKILDSYKEVEQRNKNAKGYKSKSILFQANMLAKELQRIQNREDGVGMWEVVSKVWVEMLCYAATHCDSKQHAAQLNRGGELINFVWLLMAHFGLGEQFRTTKEDSRARLILDKTTTSCLV